MTNSVPLIHVNAYGHVADALDTLAEAYHLEAEHLSGVLAFISPDSKARLHLEVAIRAAEHEAADCEAQATAYREALKA